MDDSEPSPALRLLATNARIIRSRPVVLAAALASRARLLSGHAIWKDPDHPTVALDLTDRVGAVWSREAFEPATRGRAVDPLTWQTLRARGFLIGGSESVVVEAARRALGRSLRGAQIALLSPGGSIVKATCFVTEPGRVRPTVVVRAMVDPSRGDWLRREAATVATLRHELADLPEIADALPDPPLLLGRVGHDTVVVEWCNPDVDAQVPDAERRALAWLAGFQAATTRTVESWSAADDREVIDTVGHALAGANPEIREPVLSRLRGQLAGLRGTPVARCAAHGDFWRGNIDFEGSRLRVYDWEWASPEAPAFLDHASWEFGALRPTEGNVQPHALAAAVSRIADRLAPSGLPRAFAPVALAYGAAELSTRVEREFGRAGAIGRAVVPLLSMLAPLLIESPIPQEAR